MVSKKRLYYGGFDGFRVPVVPKAPRSLRRISHKKSSASSEICPFELLAAVAGKLLQESESSVSSTGPERKQINIHEDDVKQEELETKLKPLSLDYLDQGCCAESEFVPEPPNLELKLETPSKDLPQSDNDSGLEHASIVTASDILKKGSANVKLETASNGTLSKSEGGSPSQEDLCDVDMDINRANLQADTVEKLSEPLTTVKACMNRRVLNKSYNNVHLPFHRDTISSPRLAKHRNNVKIGIRDDDENSFSCNHHSTKLRAFRLQSPAGYRQKRKMMSTKYWKSAPKLNDYEPSNNTSRGVKRFDYNRKNMFKRESYQAEIASKRIKLFHHSLKSDYVQETSSESISNLPERNAGGDKKRPPNVSNRVKLSIKSFKVPELYVEMPETSTVGSLKITVMEAVTAILGSELHVGVLLQGKKIRDDNITLEQTGISLNSDSLGFMLEPSVPEASQTLAQKGTPLLLPCDHVQPLPGSPASPDVNPNLGTSFGNQVVNNEETKVLLTEVSTEEIVEDSKAIVPITPMNPEAIAVVPLKSNPSKRSELSQRRIRRPFSVYEVEALVEAVEKLGTGRWRDVKIRAFGDANHRTYVDLKDKWKTLVHTASISPQQRRGEPVPQDLLDRVLAAHSHWSQNQSKQHGKHQTEPLQPSVKVCLEFER